MQWGTKSVNLFCIEMCILELVTCFIFMCVKFYSDIVSNVVSSCAGGPDLCFQPHCGYRCTNAAGGVWQSWLGTRTVPHLCTGTHKVNITHIILVPDDFW